MFKNSPKYKQCQIWSHWPIKLYKSHGTARLFNWDVIVHASPDLVKILTHKFGCFYSNKRKLINIKIAIKMENNFVYKIKPIFLAKNWDLPHSVRSDSKSLKLGRSPGLVVMGDSSCLKGRGFESRDCILDGHFSHWFVVKIVCLKRPKINEKESGLANFLNY